MSMPATNHDQLDPVVVMMVALARADVDHATVRTASAQDYPVNAIPVVPAVMAVAVPTSDYEHSRAIVVMIAAIMRTNVRVMYRPVIVDVQGESALASNAEPAEHQYLR
jgi:hypothetical protein